MGPRVAVASLVACGVKMTVARFAHDTTGNKAHSHTFLAFCGDDGTNGGMYTISCEFNAQTIWPDMVDGFTYLTYPVCKGLLASSLGLGTFSTCSSLALVDQRANDKGDVGRLPMRFPLKTVSPASLDVYQPVLVPVGKPETNLHHLVWPEGRRPSVAQLAADSPEAMGQARDTIARLRDLAIMHGAGSGDAELKKLHMKLDAHTLNIWDRIQIRDGLLFSTTFKPKYTDAMCARLCTKIEAFHGNRCIAYSRKWFKTDVDEHMDTCGRDGDVGISRQATTSTGWGQNYNTDKEYKYPGQCDFYGKMMVNGGDTGSSADFSVTNLCTTAEDWLLDPWGVPYVNPPTAAQLKTCTDEGAAGTGTLCEFKDSCQYRHGFAKTNWKDKTRSWRMLTTSGLAVSGYATPSTSDAQEGTKAAGGAGTDPGTWPAKTPKTPIQQGRRLMAESNFTREGHEFILPNGTSFWAWE